MKKSSIEMTLNNFVDWLELYTCISNKLISDDIVFSDKEEKVELIEALILKICALWEVLIEELMIDCLNRDSSQYSKYIAEKLPKHIPRAQCKAMIQGMGYVDFKSVSDIKKKAKLILADDFNPFKSIPRNDGDKIDEFYKFRNYIAHLSSHSERVLKSVYSGKYQLKRFQEPGRFMMAIDKNVKQPRLNLFISSFESAIDGVANHLGYQRETDPSKI